MTFGQERGIGSPSLTMSRKSFDEPMTPSPRGGVLFQFSDVWKYRNVTFAKVASLSSTVHSTYCWFFFSWK